MNRYHYRRRATLRPTTVVFTLALVIAAIAANQMWLWIALVVWLLLAVYAFYMRLNGRA